MAPVSGPVIAGGPGPVLTVTKLTLRRGRDELVRDLDWEVGVGRIAWVTGENGSGKSTLLAALAGRIRPASGHVRHHVSPQNGAGRPVRYHPDMRPPAEVQVRDWIRLVDALAPPGAPPGLIPPDLPGRQRIGELSTGQRKRLELEALLRRPASCYLLDEPFSHLSDAASDLLHRRLLGLVEFAAVVVATHRGPRGPGAESGPGDLLHLAGDGRWHVERRGAGGGR